MHDTNTTFSPRAVIAGIAGFVIATVAMLFFIESVGIDRIQAFIRSAGPLAPLAYIALKTATYVFAPLSSGPIQLSSGVLFGLWQGVLYTMIGELIGGSISFLIARYLGRPIVRRFVGEDGMNRVDQFVSQLGGWRALAYARVFLVAIYDFISYAAGFTRTITLAQYVLVSAVVGLPPTFLFVAAGASLAESREMVLVTYAALSLLTLLPLIFAWRRRRRAAKQEAEKRA